MRIDRRDSLVSNDGRGLKLRAGNPRYNLDADSLVSNDGRGLKPLPLVGGAGKDQRFARQ